MDFVSYGKIEILLVSSSDPSFPIHNILDGFVIELN